MKRDKPILEIKNISNGVAFVSKDDIERLKKKYIGKDTNAPANTEEGEWK